MIVFTSDVSVSSFCFVGVKTINESIDQGIVTDLLPVEICTVCPPIFTTADPTTAIFGYVRVSAGFLR